MRNLTLCDMEDVDELIWPENYQEITLLSPASLVFTDFKKNKPLVISHDFNAHETEKLMMNAHVRLKLVVDDNNKFLGVVGLTDINHQEIMKKVTEGHAHDDLIVTDFMQPKSMLKAINYDELKSANVGDILNTLKLNGKRHCLVVDKSKHTIRGVVSSSDIVRMLKLDFDLTSPPTFIDLFNKIHS